MMCENCLKNPATTHIKKVVNGVATEKHLCAYCAAKNGYGNFGQLSLTNLLTSMLGEGSSSGITATTRCEGCGCSFSDIVESGRMGCSECYTTFKNELIPSLKRLHGKALHVGSSPLKTKKEETLEEKIEILKKKLSEAVETQEFEKAAEIRDEIKKLEGEK